MIFTPLEAIAQVLSDTKAQSKLSLRIENKHDQECRAYYEYCGFKFEINAYINIHDEIGLTAEYNLGDKGFSWDYKPQFGASLSNFKNCYPMIILGIDLFSYLEQMDIYLHENYPINYEEQ